MDGFRCFTWNKEHCPDPKRMVKELSDDGFKTVVIIDPGIKIDKEYSVFKEVNYKYKTRLLGLRRNYPYIESRCFELSTDHNQQGCKVDIDH